MSTSDAIDHYNSTLRSIADKHAPLKERIITVRPKNKWMTDEIKVAKAYRRKLEKK